jgi:hypothetical protein
LLWSFILISQFSILDLFISCVVFYLKSLSLIKISILIS